MIARARRASAFGGIALGLACGLAAGCAFGGGAQIKEFAPPPPDVMPRHVLIAKRGEADADLDSFIDGVFVDIYFFNNNRDAPDADQPFHRDGTLAFKLYGPEQELLCEGEFGPSTMSQSETEGGFGPAYSLLINFTTRGYEDVRDRTPARLDVEFTPTAAPEQKSFGSTQIRLGPVF